jgi:predicted lipid-binding transport protein (Tim44 family)
MSPLAQILAQANRQAPAPPQATIQPTDVTGAFATADQANNQAYQSQVAAQNGMYGGLASLGGAGIGALGNYLTGGTSGALAAALRWLGK